MTASDIFKEFADDNGLISIEVLKQIGWIVDMAENEGLIIKETFKPVIGK